MIKAIVAPGSLIPEPTDRPLKGAAPAGKASVIDGISSPLTNRRWGCAAQGSDLATHAQSQLRPRRDSSRIGRPGKTASKPTSPPHTKMEAAHLTVPPAR